MKQLFKDIGSMAGICLEYILEQIWFQFSVVLPKSIALGIWFVIALNLGLIWGHLT